MSNVSKKELAFLAKCKYPLSITYKGRLTEEEILTLEKTCNIQCSSLFMDGSAVYTIRYIPKYDKEN